MTTQQQPTNWRKSLRSQNTSDCVEVGHLGAGAAVRDTKNRDLGYVTANRAQWNSFLQALKTDRFTS